MNVIQDAVHEVLRDAGLEEYQSEYRALLRRDWAVRVLDAKGREMRHDVPAPQRHLDGPTRDPVRFVVQWLDSDGEPHETVGPTEDAARLAAALAVFPTLDRNAPNWPGECP